jgi:hypothetical protein
VCAGLTTFVPVGVFPATELAYDRASSIRAATPDAECRYEQGNPDEQPGAAIEPPVDGALE